MNGLFARSTRVAVVAGAVALAACGGPEGSVRVTIPPGATVGTAADSLARAQVIGAPSLFRLYARLTKRDRNLKPGTYLLRRDASWNSILSSLVEGRGIVFTVTIPEGLQVATMAPILERELKVPPESLAAAAADSALRERLKVPTPTLEGYLFPETYVFQEGVTAQDVVRTMVREFERRWKPEWDVRLLALKMSRHEIVTLASIIEKEARVANERPVISAVYHNRLKRGMLLQADPTVLYSLGRHVDRVLYRHLRIDSPYNTYRYAGLPPGPIASPGAASLEAALYPSEVPYLYFVAHPDGHHEFRRTLREHNEAVRQMRALRQQRGRSASQRQ
ncbi:MAG TPA: endolytic transglycosylase MltG [Gemmatimonadaceae bacterium]|nr:endolytic transglycosylase MltG [Gemmatimonadaceae bacterium]